MVGQKNCWKTFPWKRPVACNLIKTYYENAWLPWLGESYGNDPVRNNRTFSLLEISLPKLTLQNRKDHARVVVTLAQSHNKQQSTSTRGRAEAKCGVVT